MGKNTGTGDPTQSGQGIPEVSLAFDKVGMVFTKTFLNFFAGVGKISTQSLTLTNCGKTTVYFDWKRGPPNILFEFEKTDYAEYFHIHNGKEVIKPGEQKTYTFTFYSTLPGQFHAQYYIDTDPKLPEELPPIELSGFAVVSDKNIENRYDFDENVRDYHVERFCSEIVEDVFQHVRTPTPPLPDYRILENRIREFEAQNKHLGLFYSEVSYQLFLLLQKHVVERSRLDPHTHAWGFQASKIKQWIDSMPASIDKTLLAERWEECVHISKKKPVDKSPSYQMFKSLLTQVATKLPELNEKALEAAGVAKKKFKNEDEEQKFFAAHKDKLAEDMAALVAEDLHTDDEFARKKLIIDDKDLRFVHGPGYFDKLGRIKLFKDSEVESKRVLAKFSLKVGSDTVLELKTPKVHQDEEADKKDPKKKGAADPKKDAKDNKPDPKKAKPGAGKPEEEESSKPVQQLKVKIGLDLIEEKSLEVFLKSVKSIQSRTPKLLMVLVTLEDAELLGTDPEEVSIKFLLEKLNSYLETKVIWEKNWVIPDWAERLENEVYPEEGVILFENLALWPLELGYEVLEDPAVKQAAMQPNIASSAVASGADVTGKTAAGTKPGANAGASAAPLAASVVATPAIPATRKFRCLYSHIAEGARTLSQYANTYILDDPTNFGRRERLSNVYIKPDYFGFGRMLSDRLSFVLGFFKSLPGKSTLLLGGKITNAKLMFLQACGHLFQNVVLVGEVGFAISSWATVFQPSLESTSNHKDRFYREFISSLQEKTNVILPRDANTLAPSTKDEQAPAAVADPKKKPADAKDPKAPKEEVSQIDEVGSLRAALGRSILQPHETELLAKHQKLVSFSGFDLAHVEEYEALLLEEAEQKKREEAARAEQERIRREEEAAKDPKKKGAAVPEKPKEATGKKPDTKPGADGPKTSTALEGSHVSREVPPFRAADSKIYFTAGMTGVSWGNETKQEVMKIVSHSNNLLWLGRLECSQALPLLDKDVAKALKNMRTAADAEEATLNADARERYVPLKIGIVGENLIGLVNSLDLKDPPPPKEAKRRRTDDEDGEGEEEQEEEPEEDSEEEEDFDDDMSSGQIRRLRKKDNVDQITGLYQPDERAVLQLLSGELLEELDRVDQAPKVVIDPDDIPFPHLVDI